MSTAVFPLTFPYTAGGIRGLTYPVMKTAEFSSSVAVAPNLYEWRVPNYFNPRWHWTLVFNYLKDNPNDVPALYAPYTDYKLLQGFFAARAGGDAGFLYLDPLDNSVGPAMIAAASAVWRANWTPIVNANIVVGGNQWYASAVTGPTSWSIPSFAGAGPVTDAGVTWTKIGTASSTVPNPDAQLQVVTDGTYYYSPLQRNFGGQFLEDVTDLNTTTAIGGSALAVYADGVLQSSPTNYTLSSTPGLATNTGSFLGQYIKWAITSPVGPPAGPVTAQFNYFFRVRFESDELDFEEFLNQVWTMGGPDTRNGAGYLKLMTARPNPL